MMQMPIALIQLDHSPVLAELVSLEMGLLVQVDF